MNKYATMLLSLLKLMPTEIWAQKLMKFAAIK